MRMVFNAHHKTIRVDDVTVELSGADMRDLLADDKHVRVVHWFGDYGQIERDVGESHEFIDEKVIAPYLAAFEAKATASSPSTVETTKRRRKK